MTTSEECELLTNKGQVLVETVFSLLIWVPLITIGLSIYFSAFQRTRCNFSTFIAARRSLQSQMMWSQFGKAKHIKKGNLWVTYNLCGGDLNTISLPLLGGEP